MAIENHSYDLIKHNGLQQLIDEYLQELIKKLPEGMVVYRDKAGKLVKPNKKTEEELFPELDGDIMERATNVKKYEKIRAQIDQFIVVAKLYKEIHSTARNTIDNIEACKKIIKEKGDTFTLHARKNSSQAKFHQNLIATLSLGDLNVESKQEKFGRRTQSLFGQNGKLHNQQINSKRHHNTLKRRFGNFS